MFKLLVVASALLMASTASAFAYLDPGTGSLVIQMIIAGGLTAAASIRIFWSRIKSLARRILGPKTPPIDPA